jgi:hypothetical protein
LPQNDFDLPHIQRTAAAIDQSLKHLLHHSSFPKQ